MNKQQISKQVNKEILLPSRNKFLKYQSILEKDVKKIYQNTNNKISSRILRATQDIKTAFSAMDGIKSLMNVNTKTVYGKIQKFKDDVIRDGIKTGYEINKYLVKATTPLKEAIPLFAIRGDYKNFDIVFNQLFKEASIALQYTVDGVELSNKIWDLNNISLQWMRDYMSNSMVQGKSQAEIYSFFKNFLVLPDVDMRKNVWKEFFIQYPPGRGIYKSAWANIMRVLRTESNRAYRQGLAIYAKDKEWVQGLKWNRVAGAEPCEICDGLADDDNFGLGPGIYPSDNAPDSGHPHCLCYYTFEIDLSNYGIE